MAKIKKYVLLESQFPTAPISILTGKKDRVRLKGMPNAAPYLQTAIVTEDGQNRILRLKLTSQSIYQDEQMLKGVPANEKFTNAEREAIKFRNGELITSNETVQKFLDNHPQNKAFKGQSIESLTPMFEERDESLISKNEISDYKKKLKAANKIADMTLEDATKMLIILNGSFHKVPDNVEDAQLDLIDLMESETRGDEVIKMLLTEEVTPDQEVNILVGKLVNAGQISFDAVPNKIVLKDGSDWKELKDFPPEYDLEQRQRLLVEQLTSEAGKPLLADLKNTLGKIEAAKQKTNEPTKGKEKQQ